MYKLQNLNIVIETDDEMKKNELISIGYKLIDEVENSNVSTADATNETSENEITKDSDISEDEELSEEENKAGKKSKAKK